jgi:steroid 5-alpha reductase family enzyme
MRRRLGPRFRWTSAFYVFGLQAALIWTVSLPIELGQLSPPLDRLTGLQIAGLVLFGVGFFFETVGDLQLARFKARPENRGNVMDRGLWRYTRHPNYFGDFMVWWGLYLLAVAAPRFFWDIGWTAVGPVLMSVLLLRVSGVTLLEASLRRRKPEYQEYARRTSAFFPWPPKRG